MNHWDVDVISLSVGWGSGTHFDAVEQAIRSASSRAPTRKNVLVFAAAGNDPTQDVQFPAYLDGLLPVFSCGGDTVSNFNSRGSSRNYFCFPGEDVRSYWPRSAPGGYPTELNSWEKTDRGTSQSTAIAAAVAACVLEFKREYENLRDMSEPPWNSLALESMRTPTGMSRVFRWMSQVKQGPMFPRPWRTIAWREGQEDRNAAMQRIANEMERHLRGLDNE